MKFDLGYKRKRFDCCPASDQPEEIIDYPCVHLNNISGLSEMCEVGSELEVKIKIKIVSKEEHTKGGYNEEAGSSVQIELKELDFISPPVEQSGPERFKDKLKKLLSDEN